MYKRQELESLGPKIEQLEAELEALEVEMAEQAADYEVLATLTARRGELEQTLEASLERWMTLEEMVEG